MGSRDHSENVTTEGTGGGAPGNWIRFLIPFAPGTARQLAARQLLLRGTPTDASFCLGRRQAANIGIVPGDAPSDRHIPSPRANLRLVEGNVQQARLSRILGNPEGRGLSGAGDGD